MLFGKEILLTPTMVREKALRLRQLDAQFKNNKVPDDVKEFSLP